MRPVVAITCLILLQGLLYILFLMRPSRVLHLMSETETETETETEMELDNRVVLASSDVSLDMAWYSGNGSEWDVHDHRAEPSRFEEDVNRDLLDMKIKLNEIEMWMRNMSTLLEKLRLWVDSESISIQRKLTNDSSRKTRFDHSSQVNTINENVKRLEEFIDTRRNKRSNVQRGLIPNFHHKFPLNIPHVKITNRPLNSLEEYFLTVRNKRMEIRNGPIVNLFDFPYVINPGYKTCAGQNVFLVAIVPTAVEHYDLRRIIRNTWASTRDFRVPVRCIFIVGRSRTGNGDRTQQLVEHESSNFGDIVQADFLDTYNNLTYKTLVGLRWAATYCHEARYVLKIDDDTFVNMFALLDRLEQDHPNSTSSNLKIFCRVVFHDEVHRTGKWAVHESEFRHKYYPPYCSGPAYVLTMTMASQIVRDSLHVPFFYFEDVYVTGFVTMLSGFSVRFVQWDQLFAFSRAFPRVFLTRDRNKYLFAIQISSTHMFMNVWHQMRQLYISSSRLAADARVQMQNQSRLAQKLNDRT